jgi:hypothetical protein
MVVRKPGDSNICILSGIDSTGAAALLFEPNIYRLSQLGFSSNRFK